MQSAWYSECDILSTYEKTNYNHIDCSPSRQSYEGLQLIADQTKVYFKCLSFWVFSLFDYSFYIKIS